MEESRAASPSSSPAIRVEFVAPANDYETWRSARCAPQSRRIARCGVPWHHRADLLAARELVVPLDPFIAAQTDWPTLGYSPSLLTLAK